jgi:hypothetical protein
LSLAFDREFNRVSDATESVSIFIKRQFLALPCARKCPIAAVQGQWVTTDGRQREYWRPVSDRSLEGCNWRLDSQGTQISEEHMWLLVMGGAIYYFAKVDHNPLPIAFELTECESDRWLFSNRWHDFPTTLEYELLSQEQLKITVSGRDKSGFVVKLVQ